MWTLDRPLRVGLLAALLGAPASAAEPVFDLELLEPLVLSGVPDEHGNPHTVLVNVLRGGALNDDGEFIGDGWNSVREAGRDGNCPATEPEDPDCTPHVTVEFRWRAGRYRLLGGFLGGRSFSLGAIANRGFVAGLYNGVFFIWPRRGPLDFMLKGADDLVPARFRFAALSGRGAVVGWSGRRTGDRIAYRYSASHGWEDLSSLPGAPAGALPLLVNDAGDIILSRSAPPPPGSTRARQQRWLLTREGRVLEITRPKRPPTVTTVQELTPEGEALGGYGKGGRLRAFRFDPEDGFSDLHPRGYAESAAVRRVAGEIVVCQATRRGERKRPSLLALLPDGSSRTLLEPTMIEALAGRAGGKLLSYRILEVSSRGEALGIMELEDEEERQFVLIPGFDPVAVETILARLAPEAIRGEVTDLNNRSELLLRVEVEEARWQYAFLRPAAPAEESER